CRWRPYREISTNRSVPRAVSPKRFTFRPVLPNHLLVWHSTLLSFPTGAGPCCAFRGSIPAALLCNTSWSPSTATPLVISSKPPATSPEVSIRQSEQHPRASHLSTEQPQRARAIPCSKSVHRLQDDTADQGPAVELGNHLQRTV